MRNHDLSRRDWLARAAPRWAVWPSAAAPKPRPPMTAPASTVSIARCTTYDRANWKEPCARNSDQIGGIGSLVKGKPSP